MSDPRIDSVIIGNSASTQALRALIAIAAPTNLPVLILGSSGVGKDLVAEALDRASGRSGPFVAFNVCEISDTMVEDSLFGHVRGSFTSAEDDKPGYLAEANGGTLFLDEIGDLSLPSQAKLLRVLEKRVYRPVGGKKDMRSDFRLVSATNHDLDIMVTRGQFRFDLLQRLKSFVIRVPELSEHLQDVPDLVEHFIRSAVTDGIAPRASVTSEAIWTLQEHAWEGNVRELRYVVQRALVLASGATVDADVIAAALSLGNGSSSGLTAGKSVARRQLVTALDRCDWKIGPTAQSLGVGRTTLWRHMRRLGIVVPDRTGRYHPDGER